MSGQPTAACSTCRLVQALATATGTTLAVVRLTNGITAESKDPR